MPLLKEDVITVNSWHNLADEAWTDGPLPKSSLVCVIPEKLADFIKLVIAEKCEKEYVVISPASDYGLVLQEDHPVNADLTPWLHFLASQRGDKYHEGREYEAIEVPPRCDTDKCSPYDLFSLKCAMFTHSTFPYIPKNVWIMTTNTDLKHPRVIKLPFGIRPSTVDSMVELHNEFFDFKKFDMLYVNFTAYTLKRRDLLLHYGNRQNEAFINFELSKGWEEYISNMARCKFVLSPQGNGIDCYRNLEAHYVGCATVMERGEASDLIRVPHFEVDSMFGLTKESLVGFEPIELSNWSRLSFWKEAIHDFRRNSRV